MVIEQFTESLVLQEMKAKLGENEFGYVFPQGDISSIDKINKILCFAGGKPKECSLDDYTIEAKGKAKPEFIITFNDDTNTILVVECKKLNGCEEGDAKITNAYNLPCEKIIHTVGPVYGGKTKNESDTLSKCYINCMNLAEEYRNTNGLDEVSIAFPCISTGAFGYPKEEASQIATNTIREINNEKIKVIFCCYEVTDYQIYIKNVYGITINYLM
jgi:O-acetyl-ADP-ribose deacetylase (regulator of RNase III)